MSVDVLATIADKAGVSPRTVQRILSGQLDNARPSILKRAEKIRALAIEMNYRPNAAARATRTGRFNSIAMILATSEYRSPLQEPLLRGIHDGLDQHGQHLFVTRYTDEALSDKFRVPRILRELNCDGLLINYHSGAPAKLAELVKECAIPAVWINAKMKTDCVHPDDFSAGRDVTQMLVRYGHTKIAYLDLLWHLSAGRGNQHFSKQDRLNGYISALNDAGLTQRVIRDDHADVLADPVEYMCSVFKSLDRPTAVVAYGESDSRVAERAAMRAGLRVPEDVSVQTFMTDTVSIVPTLRYAGMRLDSVEMGHRAVDMLMRKIEDPESIQKAEAIPGELIEGYSSGQCLNSGTSVRRY